MQHYTDTAVLVFTRTAAQEAVHKKYGHHQRFASGVQIAQKLIEHTNDEASASGLPVFTISTDLQRGDTFGERLINAIDDIFKKGYENIIAVGTDAPELSSKHITEVAQLLETHDYVSGPSQDGGIYILGINRKVFDRKQLLSIPWQSTAVNCKLEQYIETTKCLHTQIEVLKDLDTTRELYDWLNNSDSHLSFIITSLLQRLSHISYHTDTCILKNNMPGAATRRGPPAMLHIAA